MLASAAVEYSVGPHRGATYDAIQSNDMADDELHLFLRIFVPFVRIFVPFVRILSQLALLAFPRSPG